jgi:ribonucleoside-diphosphate reductase alpha chain
MERFDLAHIDPSGEGFDALGKGVEEGKPAAGRYVSKGLTRSRTDKLTVMSGGGSSPSPAGGGSAGDAGRGGAHATSSNVKAFSGATTRAEVSGTAALKSEPEQRLSPAEQLEHQHLPFAKPEVRQDARAAAAEKRAEAKARGYEGEACGECGNFTLVRNGTCMKCDTCGGTTGCS